jgi:hypothetical protein
MTAQFLKTVRVWSAIALLLSIGVCTTHAYAGPGQKLPTGITDPKAIQELTPMQGTPQQVNVSVKVVEFQARKGVESGLSLFYARRNTIRPYGRVATAGVGSGNGSITTADLTFPTDAESAITVFLDKITTGNGEIEMVLQALADENNAFILSRPRVMVMVGESTPTEIKTVRENPYARPTVVGTTVVNATDFRDTGVTLWVWVRKVIDDDGDWHTTNDTYVQLYVVADVKERGQDEVIAFDARFGASQQTIAPSFLSRRIDTKVWVRHGEVLVLGGLFRNQDLRSIETVPWMHKAENVAVGLAERVVPGNFLGTPLSSTLGARDVESQRRELVFFIKSEIWRPAYTVVDEFALFDDLEDEPKERRSPADVIEDVLEGISDTSEDIAEGVSGRESTDRVGESLGSRP